MSKVRASGRNLGQGVKGRLTPSLASPVDPWLIVAPIY